MNWFSVWRDRAASVTAPAAPEHSDRTELIRATMLGMLAGFTCPSARALTLRIHQAGNAERLWYLRLEAMNVLASQQGEAFARQALASISAQFQDVLPQGLSSHLQDAGVAKDAFRSSY